MSSVSACPWAALVGITFGIEEVPYLDTPWSGGRVPLAAAVAATPTAFGRVVLYRRPLEFRAMDREDLADLVHDVIIEQVANLLGVDPDELS